ncbi:MAG: glycosyltransferase family 1 protein [Acidobacteriota bacterium]
MKPLRIGFNARCLEEPQTRGLSRYATCLLRALSRSPDLELVLFAMTAPDADHLRNIRARVVLFSGRETVWQDRLLPESLRRERIDLFHAPADRGLPFRKPCPFVVTVHDSYERTHWRALFRTLKQRAWYWKNEMANRFRADAVLTVSDSARRDLIALGVAPARRIHRIHLAASEEFRPEAAPDDGAVVARRGVREPYVLYVGGYDRRKNVDTLVRAFDRARLPGHELVIVASRNGDYRALEAEWRTLACHPRLRCLDVPAAELPAFYRRAGLFVNPSLWESFSFQTVEAMASGTPLLASDRRAIPEIVGGAAELVDASDVDALAARMSALMADVARRLELRRMGLARAAGFSWHHTADATLQVYRDALGKGRRGHSIGTVKGDTQP